MISICIATYNKAALLQKTLHSIFMQLGDYEVIVVDDGSVDYTNLVCREYPVNYIRIDRPPKYRNPAVARNVAYRAAKGDIIIAQSDDVMHVSRNCIAALASTLKEGHFVIANVLNVAPNGKIMAYYTGPRNQRPLFFLGSLYRKDLYAVGGNDEEFVFPGREDVWFAKCLMQGLHLTPLYPTTIVGHHQNHNRILPRDQLYRSHNLFSQKHKLALKGLAPWTAASGPWEFNTLSDACS